MINLGAFILGLITDIVWTKWMQNVTASNAIYAANWSFFVYVVGVLYTTLIVDKMYVAIGLYLIGAWLGTYLTVKFSKKSNKNAT